MIVYEDEASFWQTPTLYRTWASARPAAGKFRRVGSATRKKSWGAVSVPTGNFLWRHQPNTSTPRLICPLWMRLAAALLPPPPSDLSDSGQRLLSQEARGLGVFCQTPPPTRSVPAAFLFSRLQCDGEALALHPDAQHTQSLLRPTGGVMRVVVHDVRRHAETSRQNPRTAGTLFLKSVCRFTYTRTCSTQLSGVPHSPQANGWPL